MRFKTLVLLAAGVFLVAASLQGQDVVVPLLPTDGTDATMINMQIRADTTASGGLLDTHVYELQRGQYYLQHATFTVPNGKTLRLRAAQGQGAKPVVFLWPTGTGANPTRPPGNAFILNGGNLTVENICITGYYEPEPEKLSTVQGGLIQTTGPGTTIIIDGVVFSNINGQHVRTNSATHKVQVTNSIFANMGNLITSNLGAGKGLDLREVAHDSLVLVNNTFVNFQDRAVRHYNITDPKVGTGEIKYGRIEHNTFVNGMGYHGLLSLGNVGPEIIIKNNLFVDAFALGEDPTDATRQAEWGNTGEFYADGSNRITWIFTAPNETTQWTIGNNFYAISDSGQAFLNAYGFPAGSPLSYHINSKLGPDSVNAFTQTDLSLANVPKVMTNMMRWYETPAEAGGAGKTKTTTAFNVARDDYDRRVIEFYRDTLDASYAASSDAYTGAEMGFPAGDLNWFPDMKALWSQGVDPMELTVVNPSFELPGTGKIKGWDGPGSCSDAGWTGATDDIPGWTADAQSFDSGVETSDVATDGSWVGFLKSGDPQVWQTMTRRVNPGELFLLKADARNTWQATQLELALYYLDQGARVTAAIDTVDLSNSMQTFKMLFASDDVPAALGKQIGIAFRNVSPLASSWAGLDNVQLALVTNEIVVDGKKDPFYETLTGPDDGYLQIRYFANSNIGLPKGGDSDLSAKVWSAWDAEWYYIYAEVRDDSISAATVANDWETDAMELKIDGQATDSTQTSVSNGTIITALDSTEVAEGLITNSLNAIAEGDKQYARRKFDGGYVLEYALKLDILGGTEPIDAGVGKVFGMAYHFIDNDGKGRDACIQWSAVLKDAIWNTPKYHATVKFLADNKLQFIPSNKMTGMTNPVPYDGSDDPSRMAVEDKAGIVKEFALSQNYPNPFNPTTTISYSIPSVSQVRLTVYDVMGRQVAVLVDEKKAAGVYKVSFDGQRMASGMYFYKLEAGSRIMKQKMVMLK
jgi:hypothetical protein